MASRGRLLLIHKYLSVVFKVLFASLIKYIHFVNYDFLYCNQYIIPFRTANMGHFRL